MAGRGSDGDPPTFASLTAGARPTVTRPSGREMARVKRSRLVRGVARGAFGAALFAWGCTGEISNASKRATGNGGTGSAGETDGGRGTGETADSGGPGGRGGSGGSSGSGGPGGGGGSGGSSGGQGGSFMPGQPAPPVFSCDP